MAEETNQTQGQQGSGQQAAQNAQQGQQQAGGLSARPAGAGPSHGMTPPTIDYDKLADIINGRTAAAESAALNGYFRDQGLTKEEAAQAIAAFKEQKAKNTPDPAAMQAQLAQANAAALQAQMENRAMVLASELGLDIKTVPYVMRLADLSAVTEDGRVSDDRLKEAIGKVLEDLPQLKAKTEAAAGGFRVGAGTGSTGEGASDDALFAAFNLKPKK